MLAFEPLDPLGETNRLVDCLVVGLWEHAWHDYHGKIVELDGVTVLVVLAYGLAWDALLYSVVTDLESRCSGTMLE